MISKWWNKVVYDIKMVEQGGICYQNGGTRWYMLSKWWNKVMNDIKMVEEGDGCYQNGGTR